MQRGSASVFGRGFLGRGRRFPEVAFLIAVWFLTCPTTGAANGSHGLTSRWRRAAGRLERLHSTRTGYRRESAGVILFGNVHPVWRRSAEGLLVAFVTCWLSGYTWPVVRHIHAAGGCVPVLSNAGFRSDCVRDSDSGSRRDIDNDMRNFDVTGDPCGRAVRSRTDFHDAASALYLHADISLAEEMARRTLFKAIVEQCGPNRFLREQRTRAGEGAPSRIG